MSDTPQTDASAAIIARQSDYGMSGYVTANFARSLERQRNELLEALEEQEKFNEWLRVSDPDDPFSLETMRHKMNYCADLRKAAIAKAKEPQP